MKVKILLMVLFAVGISMISFYWKTGAAIVGGIGYSILSLAFLFSLLTTICSHKKQQKK